MSMRHEGIRTRRRATQLATPASCVDGPQPVASCQLLTPLKGVLRAYEGWCEANEKLFDEVVEGRVQPKKRIDGRSGAVAPLSTKRRQARPVQREPAERGGRGEPYLQLSLSPFTMPAFSGLQMLLYGAGCARYFRTTRNALLTCSSPGYKLCTSPAAFIAQLSPATRLIEEQTSLKAHKGGDDALALVGLLLLGLGYLYLWAVYTKDEKMKRNSTSGRLALALLSFWVCKNTPHGTSLVALFGGANLVAGVLMGLSVGFGDGNAVDLELKARAAARRRADEEAKKAR
ncbi:hypothetical protein RTBOTA2_000140 [Rhodotorula toruloides]|nr:hypothetical protein RTBOTA2_000140 [Rhodotorula toruloides]